MTHKNIKEYKITFVCIAKKTRKGKIVVNYKKFIVNNGLFIFFFLTCAIKFPKKGIFLMGNASNKALEICNSRYQQLYGNYNSKSSKKILVSHFGEFSQDLVNSITNNVEETMLEAGDKKGTIKRVFSILVEGLQNVRLHGEKDEDNQQHSFLIIAQDEQEYLITFGNLILNKNIPIIEDRLKQINAYDETEVKALYMEVLTNGIISNKGGAGLGFITMAMKSKNKLNYLFEEINDKLSCFTVEVKVDRSGA